MARNKNTLEIGHRHLTLNVRLSSVFVSSCVQALEFAREVLVECNRTNVGGDTYVFRSYGYGPYYFCNSRKPVSLVVYVSY